MPFGSIDQKPRPHEIDALSLFIASKALSTQKSYRETLNGWRAFLSAGLSVHDFETADEADAYRYLAALRARPGRAGNPLAPGTIRQRLNILSHIYEYLLKRAVVSVNPFRDIMPTLPERVEDTRYGARLIDFEAARRLLDAPSAHTRQGRVDRALLALALGSGLRAGEMIGIRLQDICRTPAGTFYVELPRTKSQRRQ
jgi:site-specific recombinase XerD